MTKQKRLDKTMFSVILTAFILFQSSWNLAGAASVTITGNATTTKSSINNSYTLGGGYSVDSSGNLTVDLANASYSGAIAGTIPPAVPSVRVFLTPASQNSGSFYFTVPSSGTYSFSNLPPGDYQVTPVADGWEFSPSGAGATVTVAGGTVPLNFAAYQTLFQTECPVNAVCGSSNGQTLTGTPQSGLCSVGQSNSMATTSNGWSWNCQGTLGGASTNCYAYQAGPPVNGSCGSSNLQTLPSQPAAGLCSSGTASAVSGGATGPWTWSCAGSNGGNTASCSAQYGTTPTNGVCGSSNLQALQSQPTTGLCSSGTPSAVSGTGPWTWSCSGINGGTNASCSASLLSTSAGVIPLTVNLGTNSRVDTFAPGQVRLYTFTIPAGATFKNITVGADSQNQHGNVDVILAKNNGDGISTWYAAALNSYKTGLTYWTMNYFASYSSGAIPAWARMTSSSVGQSVVLSQYTADGKGHIAAIPGTYYVMMKNEHPTDTAYIFVYVNGGY